MRGSKNKIASKVFLIVAIVSAGVGALVGLVFILQIFTIIGTYDPTGEITIDSILVSIFGLFMTGFATLSIVIASIALKKLETAKKKEELLVISILVLFLVSLIPGILMLLIPEEELNPVSETSNLNNTIDL